VAVHTKGLWERLQFRTNTLIFSVSFLTLEKEPWRMACWVMMANHFHLTDRLCRAWGARKRATMKVTLEPDLTYGRRAVRLGCARQWVSG
jgi:hypothetical protein